MRTPLNTILSMLKIVMASVKDVKLKNSLNIVYSSAEMLRYLVNDMLDLFAIKTDQFRKSEKPTNMQTDVVKILYDIFIEPF